MQGIYQELLLADFLNRFKNLKRYAHISETLKRDETSEVVQTRESEREVHVTCECDRGCVA